MTAPTYCYCYRCKHDETKHAKEVIPPGTYVECCYSSWWSDPMFSPTQDCRCAGYKAEEKRDEK